MNHFTPTYAKHPKIIASIIALIVCLFACPRQACAQSVQLTPVPMMTFFNGSGAPLAGGFVFFYNNGTTTPAPTYTDSSGTILNTNPVQLDSAGRAQIWIAQQAYTVCVDDANLVQQYCVNGVTSGANLLVLTNTWTNPQTWQSLGTFQNGVSVTNGITTDTLNASGGIGVGGAPVSLTGGINGNPGWTLAVSNTALLTLNAGALVVNGTASATQLISTIATGTPPLAVASTTTVANLDATSIAGGETFAAPGALGSTTPAAVTATTITDNDLAASGCVFAAIGGALTVPSTTPCLNPAVVSTVTQNLAGTVSLTASTTRTVDSKSLTMPASGCPCRILVSYTYFSVAPSGGSTPSTIAMWASDGTTTFAVSEVSVNSVSNGQGNTGNGLSASFANGAAATITISARADAAETINTGDLVGASLKSNMQLTVVTSQ